ncbi:uncharacterized protein RG961_007714 isoform 2-T2 [Leptosomus discolor]
MEPWFFSPPFLLRAVWYLSHNAAAGRGHARSLGGAKPRTDQRPEEARRFVSRAGVQERSVLWQLGQAFLFGCAGVTQLPLELGAASNDSCSVQHGNWCGAVERKTTFLLRRRVFGGGLW